MKATKQYDLIWRDKKRHFGLPLSFTTYSIIEKPGSWIKLFVKTGILSIREEETHIYRIDDISVHASLGQRLFGCGTVRLWCKDSSDEYVELLNIKNPYEVRDTITELVEKERAKRGFAFIEHSHA